MNIASRVEGLTKGLSRVILVTEPALARGHEASGFGHPEAAPVEGKVEPWVVSLPVGQATSAQLDERT